MYVGHDEDRGGKSITEVYGNVTRVQNENVTEGMELQQVGTEV